MRQHFNQYAKSSQPAKISVAISTMMASVLALTACQNHSKIEQVQMPTPSTVTKPMSTNNSNANSTNKQQQISATELQRYNWTLVNAVDEHNRALKPLTDIKNQVELHFSQQNNAQVLGFNVGCNSMGADYQLANNLMNVGDVMSTQMFCQDLDQAERLLSELMQGSSQLGLKTGGMPVLTQVTANNATLVWQGTLTPQAKYNHKGETVFWAVKSETKPCNDGLGGTTSCLQIQPLSYNEQGQKKVEGQWQLFNGSIEGYEHNDGVNQILRLNRYVVNAPHVKGKQYAYVLDQIVESEVSQ